LTIINSNKNAFKITSSKPQEKCSQLSKSNEKASSNDNTFYQSNENNGIEESENKIEHPFGEDIENKTFHKNNFMSEEDTFSIDFTNENLDEGKKKQLKTNYIKSKVRKNPLSIIKEEK